MINFHTSLTCTDKSSAHTLHEHPESDNLSSFISSIYSRLTSKTFCFVWPFIVCLKKKEGSSSGFDLVLKVTILTLVLKKIYIITVAFG
jgi:hypothetical protein